MGVVLVDMVEVVEVITQIIIPTRSGNVGMIKRKMRPIYVTVVEEKVIGLGFVELQSILLNFTKNH